EIAAHDDGELKKNRDEAGDPGNGLRQKVAKRDEQFGEVIEQHAAVVDPARRPMEIPAQRIRHGLGFIVVVEAGEIAPARVAAQLDQSGAEHDAKEQPTEQPNRDLRRSYFCAAQEDSEERGFKENGFPTESIEGLADVDEG